MNARRTAARASEPPIKAHMTHGGNIIDELVDRARDFATGREKS
ncbi:hypothetical protein SLV14_000054 [Streptomyces sp. Je 1-4]|nr:MULTISPECIES: hypothetical protein [unclassified Streptomyces]UYB45097.1 hypothetical protein SLV14_000054 [Streptomyces sp. Je 1-4]UZQ33697.1 hypothetical protein SLV14N_000054 [Streptomyces sp. Je 1-4] [Streptomyces sp. Je 1-4 4N24]UZQ41115.1 hypothetical protein SLV14NA_000054 [Streptomyces sp. Je 1-4] [Streptomyces sp. Je 1-4 4N24_ara]